MVDAGDGIWEVQRLVHEAELREHVETERLEGLFNRSQEVLQELRRLPLKEPEVTIPQLDACRETCPSDRLRALLQLMRD